MHDVLIGIFELTLASLLFFRVMPALQAQSRLAALKSWALGFALSCYGMARFIGGLGERPPPWMYDMGHWCLIVCAALWYWHLRHARVKSFCEAREARATAQRGVMR